MEYSDITLKVNDDVVTIELNRDHSRNAISKKLIEEVHDVFQKVSRREIEARVVVVTGNGKAFCAGGDLKEIIEHGVNNPLDMRQLAMDAGQLVLDMQALEVPIICAVNGAAAGAGFNLAIAGDIILAKSTATFTQAFIHIGLVPDIGGTHLLPRLVGAAKARELVMTGRTITAGEAYELGIVNEVIEPNEFDNAIKKWVDMLKEKPTRTIGMSKKLLYSNPYYSLQEAIEREAAAQGILINSYNGKEGLNSFLEKRPAQFRYE